MKTFTIDANDLIEMLCRRVGNDGRYREGTSQGGDPTFWSARSAFIYREARHEEDQVWLLEINQCWGTEIKLTWLAPRNSRKRDRVKINVYYDRQATHEETRPLTQEHCDMLLGMMVDQDTEWMRSRPLVQSEEEWAA